MIKGRFKIGDKVQIVYESAWYHGKFGTVYEYQFENNKNDFSYLVSMSLSGFEQTYEELYWFKANELMKI